jgi:arginine decarboxylase
MATKRDLQKYFPILLIDDELGAGTAEGDETARIVQELSARGFHVIGARTSRDGELMVLSKPEIGCVLLDWDIKDGSKAPEIPSKELVRLIRERNENLPIFLFTDKLSVTEIPSEVLKEIKGYFWKLEDTPSFLAGRIEDALEEYVDQLLPPFFGRLAEYAEKYKYAWHTPGHMGGMGFLNSPAGRIFFNFFGENVFRSDLSVSVPELGSLLEHSGVVGEAEREAAQVFGADRTYFVTNGTSTANKIVFHGFVPQGDVVLIDRNCHKSVMHAIIMTRAVPIYLVPRRNAYGIIGPIHPGQLSKKAIDEKLRGSRLVGASKSRKVRLAVITNSTYDGLCYNTDTITHNLKGGVEGIMFDEAWYGYAKFHKLYEHRYAMFRGNSADPTEPVIFATQSTHKVLAALSQGSMIHVRGQGRVDHERFNEAYMMHTSTSPQYEIVASLDVAAKMMEGASGRILIDAALEEAVIFRKKMVGISRDLAQKSDRGGWWFRVWQPMRVAAASRKGASQPAEMEFDEVETSALLSHPEYWTLKPGDEWHGFNELEEDFELLDPTKVTLLMPGIGKSGKMEPLGIPAVIVSRFLWRRGIVVEKTGHYSSLILFTIGTTKGKSGTLLAELLEFKRLFDENAPLTEVFPDLTERFPDQYAGLGLSELCTQMHGHLAKEKMTQIVQDVYDVLPDQEMTPAEAYDQLVRGKVEYVKLRELNGRVPAVMVVPYPPGIPVIMPGEKFGAPATKILDYLPLLEDFDNKYPGFENEVHGVTLRREKDGKLLYTVMCLK